jgi:hypothetical protein
MLIAGKEVLWKPFLRLFNMVIKEQIMPKSWCCGMIVAIFKSGNREDPNDYRGITISSCLGKLFTKILANRLVKFLDLNNVITEYQIGFTKKARTTDHILILKTIIDLAKKKHKKVFACFVDLKKAFDTVWHEGLLLKLYKIGLSSSFCKIIESMYAQLESSIKIDSESCSQYFITEVGTRQGCNLSPWLFNIFINEIPHLLSKSNVNPVMLGNKEIPILMYADDMVLLSGSACGLQRSLGVLHNFCNKWKLRVNEKKTQVLIFNCKKKTQYSFKFGNFMLKNTDSYNYLGITFTPSGSFKTCKKNLYGKAMKALMSIKKICNFQEGNCIKVAIKLFDSIIAPILLYGCEVWGFSDFRLKHNSDVHILDQVFKKDGLPFEKMHFKFCKQMLQLPMKAVNRETLAELGRYPLMVNIITRSIPYLVRLVNSPNHTLLGCAHKSGIECKSSSVYVTNTILQQIDAHNTMPINASKYIVQAYSKKCKRWVQSVYNQSFFKSLKENDGKLIVYKEVKNVYRMEKYLTSVIHPKFRKAITQIRLSSHKFPIEKGRRDQVARVDRKCNKCHKGVVGDELHVILECDNIYIQRLRFQYIIRITKIVKSFEQLGNKEKFLYLVHASDLNIINLIGEFFYNVISLF